MEGPGGIARCHELDLGGVWRLVMGSQRQVRRAARGERLFGEPDA